MGKRPAFSQELKDNLERCLAECKKRYSEKQTGYIKAVAEAFNATSKEKLTMKQIRNYRHNKKRKRVGSVYMKKTRKTRKKKVRTPAAEEETNAIVCRNVRSLGSPRNDLSSRNRNFSLPTFDEPMIEDYPSLPDDIPRLWEYRPETGCSTGSPSSPGEIVPLEFPIHNDRDPFDFDEDSVPYHSPGKNGMNESGELVRILTEQAKQLHQMKMKVLKEKFRQTTEIYKTKVWMLERDYEMKTKRHEKKMENLQEEYTKIKEGIGNC